MFNHKRQTKNPTKQQQLCIYFLLCGWKIVHNISTRAWFGHPITNRGQAEIQRDQQILLWTCPSGKILFRELLARCKLFCPLTVKPDLNCVLADSQSVPQLDGLVTWGGDNLSVVGREGNAHHIFLMAHKAAGSFPPGQQRQYHYYWTILQSHYIQYCQSYCSPLEITMPVTLTSYVTPNSIDPY